MWDGARLVAAIGALLGGEVDQDLPLAHGTSQGPQSDAVRHSSPASLSPESPLRQVSAGPSGERSADTQHSTDNSMPQYNNIISNNYNRRNNNNYSRSYNYSRRNSCTMSNNRMWRRRGPGNKG